jgi:hypothetical protein
MLVTAAERDFFGRAAVFSSQSTGEIDMVASVNLTTSRPRPACAATRLSIPLTSIGIETMQQEVTEKKKWLTAVLLS